MLDVEKDQRDMSVPFSFADKVKHARPCCVYITDGGWNKKEDKISTKGS
jgi:hypothetical protein